MIIEVRLLLALILCALLPSIARADQSADIKKALRLCEEIALPNTQARVQVGDYWEKHDYQIRVEYSALTKKLATSERLQAVVNFVLNLSAKSDLQDDIQWECALDIIGRSGLDSAVPLLVKYRSKDHSGDGGDLVDSYLNQYKTRPRDKDWKPYPFIH
jgi:hypothetical protein